MTGQDETQDDFLMLDPNEARICRDAVAKMDVVMKVPSLSSPKAAGYVRLISALYHKLDAFTEGKEGEG